MGGHVVVVPRTGDALVIVLSLSLLALGSIDLVREEHLGGVDTCRAGLENGFGCRHGSSQSGLRAAPGVRPFGVPQTYKILQRVGSTDQGPISTLPNNCQNPCLGLVGPQASGTLTRRGGTKAISLL
jgi:hypothetical protein